MDVGLWPVCVIVIVIGITTDGLTYWAPAMGLQIVFGLAAMYYLHWKRP